MPDRSGTRDDMRTLSLGSSTLFNATPLEVIDAAAAAGLGAAGVRVSGRAPGDGAPAVAGDAGALRALRRRKQAAGIAITHVTAYWALPEAKLAPFLPVIDAAAELGSEMIVVNNGDPDESRFAAFMAAYCEAAARHGLRLVLEFMPYSGTRTLEQAARAIVAAGQPNFGLMLDPLHLARSGGTPAAVREIGRELIDVVQLCDAPLARPPGVELRTEALSDRLYPGEGELPLHELLDAAGPNAQIDIEAPCRQHAGLPPAEQAARAVAACRRFLATRAEFKNPLAMRAT